MPAIIHAKVVLEGRSVDPGARIQADLTCIRALLDDVFAIHNAAFQNVFGTLDVPELLADWRKNGFQSRQVPIWVEKLRKAAFESDNLGETSVEVRNTIEPDIAPGVVPVFCAILDHLAGCCGSEGVVILVLPDETQ